MIHTNKRKIYCHYFNNDKNCPYEKIGCKFVHETSKLCRNGDRCPKKLCYFQHNKSISQEDNVLDVSTDQVVFSPKINIKNNSDEDFQQILKQWENILDLKDIDYENSPSEESIEMICRQYANNDDSIDLNQEDTNLSDY